MAFTLDKAKHNVSVINKSKKMTNRLRSGNRSPYSDLGLYIKKMGEQRKKNRENLSFEDRLRAKKVPDQDVDLYIGENGLDSEDAALYRKDKSAFRNMVGNTISNNTQWQASYLKNRRKK